MAKRNLKNAVVVITGATSGIGRATALAFADKGAHLVLAARKQDKLDDIQDACIERGGLANTIQTDVTNSASVKYLAEHAAELGGGRIDVWVNNAGVGAVGDFLDTPLEAHEKVIRTNLLGYLYGAHSALPFFVEQGEGVLINNISFGAWFPAPFAAAYSASKYGLEGFSQALRGELFRWPGIRICDVYPAFVNTPGVSDNAANYTGRDLGKPSLAIEPEKVADAMVSLAQHPRDHLLVGLTAHATRVVHAVSPNLTRSLAARFADRFLGIRPEQTPTSGGLFEAGSGNRTMGADPRPRQALRFAGAALAIGGLAYLLTRPQVRQSQLVRKVF